MPYSHLLMTLIFIKLRSDRDGVDGDRLVSPAPRRSSQGGCYARMNCSGWRSRAGVTGGTQSTQSVRLDT